MLWSGHKLAAFSLLVALAPASRVAQAQQIPAAPSQVRFRLGWPDVALVGLSTAVARLLPGMHDSVAAPCAPCDPGVLWGIDRIAVGPIRGGLGTASDAAMAAALGGGALALALSRPGQGNEARLEDIAVYVEAVSVTQVATTAMKQVVGRSRPVMYTGAATPTTTRDALGSLPSGHASSAFAAAAAYWSIMQRRGEAGQHRSEIVGLFTMAAATAALRVAARKHFTTDVVAGAALGIAIGWTLPQVHAVR